MKALMVVPYITYETFEYHDTNVLSRTRLFAFTNEDEQKEAYSKAICHIVADSLGTWDELLTHQAPPSKPAVPFDANLEQLEEARLAYEKKLDAYDAVVARNQKIKELSGGDFTALTLEELKELASSLARKLDCVERCYEVEVEVG